MKYLAFLLVVATSVATNSFAGDKAEGAKHWHKQIAQHLNLTAEQKKAMSDMRKSHRDANKALREAVQAQRKDLMAALQSPNKGPEYQAQLTTKFNALEAKRTELSAARFQMALQMRELLNPDQIAKFKGIGGFHGDRE